MTPRFSNFLAGALAAAAAAAFAWFLRLPLPFPGFAALCAAGLAFLGTIAIVCWMPRNWVWTDAERLRLAFQARHRLSEDVAGLALETIATAHQRAQNLRVSATAMRPDTAQKVVGIADRLDTAAREIFYMPERQRSLRKVLVRSALIEEAAEAHAALRRRKQAASEQSARDSLLAAISALEAAFEETDLLAARGLLHKVEIASDVAERLLTPRAGKSI